MKNTMLIALVVLALSAQAQLPDHIYRPSIHAVKLFKSGDIYSYPVLLLNGTDQLELHFDDLDADVKNFYYSFQLCNADWTPADIQVFDYIRGFPSVRISNYRYSSISMTRYTHYQAFLPDRNCVPTRSGNYLLKVFANNDTSALYFTRRILVVENKVAVAAQVVQPFNVQAARTDQRVQVGINTANARINIMSPQDIRVVILQNNTWPTAAHLNRPNIFRGNYLEYNDDAATFPAGREWRWIDLRSLRLMSDRMRRMIDTLGGTDVYVKPDAERKGQIYVYYRDLDGLFTLENSDGNNPYWQSDYARVHFTFVPPNGEAYAGRDLYLFGELTNYSPDADSRMQYNPDKGVYEGSLFLKQGYYNYAYISLDPRSAGDRFSLANTEGNFNTTENYYTVLVYYRSFGARADELIGYALVNSVLTR